MKLCDIPFEDEALKKCVLETGLDDTNALTQLRCRKKRIKSLKGIEYLTELKLIDFTRNLLTGADLSKNTKLEEIFLGNNQITYLNLDGCKELKHLEIFINDLESLDLSTNTLLEEIYANGNDLTKIALHNNPELVDLRLKDNELEELDTSNNTKLERVDIEGNPFVH